MFAALIVQSRLDEKIMRWRAAKNGDCNKPEDHHPLMAWTAPVLPAGLFWYSWSVDRQTHWIVPILGTVLVGVAVVFIMASHLEWELNGLWVAKFSYTPPMIYPVDVFGPDAGASALAALTVLRSIAGAFLPLAGPPMYQRLQLG